MVADGDKSPAADGDAAQVRPDAPTTMTGLPLIGITIALMLAVFLVALDTNILSIAIPRITTDFNTLSDVSWYSAAYSLTRMALQPAYGRLYHTFQLKPVFIASIGLFCVGSTVCATARSSAHLIAGRAVQGSGCSGVVAGSLTIMNMVVSKRKSSLYLAIIGTMYSVSSIIGPIVGGAFTESGLTWRFCFWINLPISVVPIGLVLVLFCEPDRDSTKLPLGEKLATLDPIGTAILLSALVSLTLALQWGGISLSWGDSRVWGCLLGFGLLSAVFIASQVFRPENRVLIPLNIITQRTVAASSIMSVFWLLAVNVLTYYLPFYFQAARGMSPSEAGQQFLAFAVPSPIFTLAAGVAVTMTGHYIPWILGGGVLFTVGCGVLSMLDLDSSLGDMIGFQLLASTGFGFGVQMPLTAIRNVLDTDDMPMASSLFVFSQGFGQILGPVIGQSVFVSSLKRLLSVRLDDEQVADLMALGAAGVTDDQFAPSLVSFVREAYAEAYKSTMYAAVGAAGVAFLCSLAIERKRLVDDKHPGDDEGHEGHEGHV